MRKKWLLSVTVAVGLLAAPSVGFGAPAKAISPNQFTLENSGSTDGIIQGGFCIPDVHVYSKSEFADGKIILFSAGVKESAVMDLTDPEAAYKALLDYSKSFTIYVEIKSNGQGILELPLSPHGVDPKSGKPFWLTPLFNDLPTGDYNYSFKAKANDTKGNGHVLGTWVPKNHKFTIVD